MWVSCARPYVHAHAHSHAPLQTIWVEKFVFWKAQYAGVLAEGKLCYVLKASSFAMTESLWLEGLILCLQNVITITCAHTQTHTWVSSHTINVVRKEQRKIWRTRALFSREQGMPTCQSFSQEGLLLPVFKTRRKWKHGEGFWGRNAVTWECRMSLSSGLLSLSDRRPLVFCSSLVAGHLFIPKWTWQPSFTPECSPLKCVGSEQWDPVLSTEQRRSTAPCDFYLTVFRRSTVLPI